MKITNEELEILNRICFPLLQWYGTHKRALPWRETTEPYRVWVSEIMLQQTRVEAVKPYFTRFMEVLPNTAALAAAPEEQLLKLWEGLGYYSRARNLQKAAKVIETEYKGIMPNTHDALLRLPGIGAYTAGAIASISFGVPVAAVDGNVMRVISRLLASTEDIGLPQTKKYITELVNRTIPSNHPGDFNQALMELGATVCVPNGIPDCHACPVRPFCRAYRQNLTEELPVKSRKKTRTIERYTIFLFVHDRTVAIRQRIKSGLLAGLWEFPSVPGHMILKEALEQTAAWGLSVCSAKSAGPFKHIFTHKEWHMEGYLIEVADKIDTQQFVWATKEELIRQYAIPSAFSAYLAAVIESLPGERSYL